MAAEPERLPVVVVTGPTASGKTPLAIDLALRFAGEIVNADSMQVFRFMDIGTAKPTAAERARVPHHLIDVADPSESFTVQRYQRLALETIDGIRRRGRTPLLVGGSGLYVRAVVDRLEFPGTDPATRRELERAVAALGAERLYAR